MTANISHNYCYILGRVIVDVIHPQAIEEIKIKLVCTVWHKKAAYNNEVDLKYAAFSFYTQINNPNKQFNLPTIYLFKIAL